MCKIDDGYTFSVSFDWPVKNDDGEWETLSTTMNVEAEWNDDQDGYEISFDCPDEYVIVESGSNLAECYNDCVHEEVLSLMDAEGIPVSAICYGGVA